MNKYQKALQQIYPVYEHELGPIDGMDDLIYGPDDCAIKDKIIERLAEQIKDFHIETFSRLVSTEDIITKATEAVKQSN
jgi:hypothetical protein